MKNHYVPEFLLKRWVNQEGQLLRYTLPRPTKIAQRYVFPSQVGFERDLYTVKDANGSDYHKIETEYFQTVDFAASEVLHKILNDGHEPMSDIECLHWGRFVFSLFHRMPESLDMWKKKWKETEFSDRSYPTDKQAEHLAKIHIPFFIDSETVIGFLATMDWKLLNAETSRHSLLISDQLLTMTNGLKVSNGHLAFPISPTKIVIGISPGSNILDQIIKLKIDDIVTSMNRQTVERARSFVCAHDEKQDRFIRNRFGSKKLAPIQSLITS